MPLRHPAGARGPSAIYGGEHPERVFVDLREDGRYNLESWFPDVAHRLVLSRKELQGLAESIRKALT